jgi:hypothetical protein
MITAAQRKLIHRWLIAAALLAGMFISADLIAENWSWLRIPVGIVIAIGLALQSRSRAELRTEGMARWGAVIDNAPWVKVWLGFWAALFIVGAIYVTRKSIDVLALFGVRGMFLAFAFLLGPLLVLSETHRFRQLGGSGDAT